MKEQLKKNVMLIANYWHFEEEKTSSRYRSMANVISEKHNLEVITSSFRHLTKKQRDTNAFNLQNLPYKVTMLFEPDYYKNISLRRIRSHHTFANNIKKYLEQSKKTDCIIVSVPSLSVGDVVTKYAKKHKIPVIVDIQDLWPEAFKMAINIPVISDILFAPMMHQANRIYKRASKILAVSETYVNRGLRNCLNQDGISIFIGTDSVLAEKAMEGIEVPKKENEFWVGYIGALGHSYDINTVSNAIKILKDKGIENIVFKVMGEGPLKEDFQTYANKLGIKSDFTGFIDYGTMMATLSKCDVAVNPIVGKSVSSIINKVSDYAMAGTAVVNTQNSPEYRKLIDTYHAGINVENGNAEAVANAILQLYQDRMLLTQMQDNSKRLGKEKFDRNKTYLEIIDIIEAQE